MVRTVQGETVSVVGFYIGDLCYALSDEAYYGGWGRMVKDSDRWKDSGSPGFQEGAFTYDGSTVIVAHTAHGDGCYHDATDSIDFPVDSGCIGIVPLELVGDMEKAANLGKVVLGRYARMYVEDGRFRFRISTDEPLVICIDTNDGEDD